MTDDEAPPALTAADLLRLQRQCGNQAVLTLLRRHGLLPEKDERRERDETRDDKETA